MNSQARILHIFLQLLDGQTLSKRELMEAYQKDASSIQRDITIIQKALEARAEKRYLEKDIMTEASFEEYIQEQSLQRFGKGLYKIDFFDGMNTNHVLTDAELLIILKILLASRALDKAELDRIVNKLLSFSNNGKQLEKLIANEKLYYKGVPQEKLMETVEFICEGIVNRNLIQFDYYKLGENTTLQRVPNAIYFSDMYLYMLTDHQTAQDDADTQQLSKFRINNMKNIRLISSNNKSEHKKRFEGGFLRKQTNLAFLGKPITMLIDFYWDPVYVLDRFPDSRIISETNGVYRIEMQVNDGYGMKMWLLSQGDMVKVISPQHMKDYIINDMKDALAYYGYEVVEKRS